MVGPLSETETRTRWHRFGAAFVAVVGLSAGMTALYGGASLGQILLLMGSGLAVGVVLAIMLTSLR